MNKALPLGVVAALAIAMGLTGCGGGGGGGAGGSAKGAWDINEQPASAVKQGGTFTGVIGSQIATWNVQSADGNDLELVWLESPMFGNWYLLDGTGKPTMNKDYLASMDDKMENGKEVLRFSINPKAVWGDGAPIVAADWIATWKALNGENTDFSIAASDGWNQIESVAQGATERDVVITFKAAFPDWTALFSGFTPMRAESCADAKTFNDGWKDFNKAWFAGPFTVTSYDAASTTVTMEPNPVWWGAKPKLDKVVFKYVSTDQQATAFANGETSFVDVSADPAGYAQAAATPNATVRNAPGPNFRHFTFNSKAGVLADVKVRQAIVQGLDRGAIATSDLAGLPVTPESAKKNSNLWMQSQAGYTDWGAKTGIQYDPAAAKKTLESDGYTMGPNGFYQKDGKDLTVKFAMLSGVPASENEYQLAASQLKAIGINLTQQTVNTATDWPGVLTSYNFDIIAFSWMGTAWPLMNIGQIYGSGSDSNFAQLTIPKVDELIPQIATESDPAKRQALAQQADQAIWEAVHTLPLYERPSLIATPSNLANFGSWGMAQSPQDWTIIGFTS